MALSFGKGPSSVGAADMIRQPSQLDRIESKIDHVHSGLHLIISLLIEMSGEEDPAVTVLVEKLRASAAALSSAVAANNPHAPLSQKEAPQMTNPLLDALAAQVKASTDAEASAVLLINGFAARMDAAIAAALAGGATAAELAPIQAEVDALKASSTALAAAVLQNTPSAPASAPKSKP